jgi:hypothetical protein
MDLVARDQARRGDIATLESTNMRGARTLPGRTCVSLLIPWVITSLAPLFFEAIWNEYIVLFSVYHLRSVTDLSIVAKRG